MRIRRRLLIAAAAVWIVSAGAVPVRAQSGESCVPETVAIDTLLRAPNGMSGHGQDRSAESRQDKEVLTWPNRSWTTRCGN